MVVGAYEPAQAVASSSISAPQRRGRGEEAAVTPCFQRLDERVPEVVIDGRAASPVGVERVGQARPVRGDRAGPADDRAAVGVGGRCHLGGVEAARIAAGSNLPDPTCSGRRGARVPEEAGGGGQPPEKPDDEARGHREGEVEGAVVGPPRGRRLVLSRPGGADAVRHASPRLPA